MSSGPWGEDPLWIAGSGPGGAPVQTRRDVTAAGDQQPDQQPEWWAQPRPGTTLSAGDETLAELLASAPACAREVLDVLRRHHFADAAGWFAGAIDVIRRRRTGHCALCMNALEGACIEGERCECACHRTGTG